ncbi:hypothetical protein D3C72_1991420 [compost metagenome]
MIKTVSPFVTCITSDYTTIDGTTFIKTVYRGDSWEGAIDFCNNLNSAGYSDWVLTGLDDMDNLYGIYSDADILNDLEWRTYFENYVWTDAALLNNDAWKRSIVDNTGVIVLKPSLNTPACLRRY